MPRQPNNQILRHRFGGGWAPDIGPTADVTVDDSGNVVIPYLLNAENCAFELDGGPHKEYGTTALSSTPLSGGTNVKGLYDFWSQGTGGSPQQHRIVHHSSSIYSDDGDNSFTELFASQTVGAVPSYSQFDDMVIIANDANNDVPLSWDGSTAQNLAGSPPNFAFSTVHSAHVFAAGVDANPSTLYYSAPNDPETWSGGGAGNILVDPNDGDRITGLLSYKQRLVVFKGPYKGSIHIITGSSSSNFARVPLQTDIGAVWQNQICRYLDDAAFLWSDGHIYSLSATDRFGDFAQGARITQDIDRWIQERVNFNRLRHAWLVNWPARGIMLCALPIDSSNHPNFILMIDYRFSPPRLAPWYGFDHMTCLAQVNDPNQSDRKIVMAGGSDGRIYRLGQPVRSLMDGSTAITYEVTTPFLNYGTPMVMKNLQHGSLGLAPKNDSTITIGWTRDNFSEQSLTITQGAGDVLGDDDGMTETGEFVLDTSTLTGARFVDRFFDFRNGGEFRAIQYRLEHTSNSEDVEIHSMTTSVVLGGVALENT